MIPKTIHYCWFGRGELPELAKKCIASWEKHCPDFENVQWNEDNFDVKATPYTRWCYEQKKYAFLSDYVRLSVIHRHGGVYFDTDVEVLRSFSELLEYPAFFGFESKEYINTGCGFGAEAGHPAVAAMLEQYDRLHPDETGAFPLKACPALNTAALLPHGLKQNGSRQTVCGSELLPMDYMNPYDDPTGKLNKTEHTISVHWYAKSWLSPGAVLRSRLTRPFHRMFGTDCFRWLRRNKR